MASKYSVSQVNQYIKAMFKQDFFLSDICIEGEVSNCKYHSSGHIYFTLKDVNSSISAIMFKGNRDSGLRFQLSDGMKIEAKGSVESYERDGRYQIYVSFVKKAGLGDLYERYLKLKEELEDFGLFSEVYKKDIPKFCRRIGIVTSGTGAAIRDIVSVSRRRNPYVELILYPAIVQGDFAAPSIVRGIEILDKLHVDCIIVGRGGGSLEDLWAFNEEVVARAIFDANTPIISAVGHETDFTIADFVADLRAATPSAAAELANFDYYHFVQNLGSIRYTLRSLMQSKMDRIGHRLHSANLRLDALSPATRLRESRARALQYSILLQNGMHEKFHRVKHRFLFAAEKLHALSPLNRISGGFAFVTDEHNRRVKSVKEVNHGDDLKLRLRDGQIYARVTEIENGEEK